MRSSVISTGFFSALLLILGCSTRNEKLKEKPILTNSIVYDVPINNDQAIFENGSENTEAMWFNFNIEASTRCEFLNMFYHELLNGHLDIVNDKGVPISRDEVRTLITSRNTVRLQREYPPYSEFDTVMDIVFQPQEIRAFRFKEKWNYDSASMAITKSINAVAPLFYSFDSGNSFDPLKTSNLRPLFWVNFSSGTEGKKVLTKRIISQVSFRGPLCLGNSDSSLVTEYLSHLYNLIFLDSIPAYEFAENIIWDSLISGKYLEKKYKDIDPLEGLSTIRFLEEWYFDTETMEITKKVVGICPVKEIFNEEGEFLGWKPLLWIYFHDPWMPFDKRLELSKYDRSD